MNIKSILVNLGKVLLCCIVFSIGFIVGGMFVRAIGLRQPPMPEGMDPQSAMLSLLLESPLFVIILAFLARNLSGGLWLRALILASLAWISAFMKREIYLEIALAEAHGVLVHYMRLQSFPPIQMWDFSTYRNLIRIGYETASRHISDWNQIRRSEPANPALVSTH